MMSTAQIKKPEVHRDIEKARQEMLASMNWKTRATNLRTSNCKSDVSISMARCKNSKPSMDVYFRNNVSELIDNGTGRIAVAFIEKRVYFKPDENGYKISDSSSPDRKTVRLRTDDDFSAFIGDYELKYDSFLELYYVEVEGNA